MKRKYKIFLGVIAFAFLGVGYYAASPLWRTVTLSEARPVGAEVVIVAKSIVDTPTHPASGTVSVLQSGEKRILRYEDFKTINGPDLRIYLSTDLEATEFVDVGELKATEGSVNYDIPPGIDIEKYRYALVWCEDFGVLFNSAELQP
jgi:Electron transfer DM13